MNHQNINRSAKNRFPDGVWPTMITPFTSSNKIDYSALEAIIEWYVDHKIDGLFAVCQSSEMFDLSLEERTALATFVKNHAPSHIPVIASGHVSDTIEGQIRELEKIAETGIDAFVLVTNRLARKDESDACWKANLQKILDHIPDSIPLGLYECPFPYKRMLSIELLEWVVSTGRFYFLKDTSCDERILNERLTLLNGTRLKLYNANSATLYTSLKVGASGYSGVMANFHPELYVKGLKLFQTSSADAEYCFHFLSVASLIEYQFYPVNAKYHLQREGLPVQLFSRVKDQNRFTAGQKLEVEQLRNVSNKMQSFF
ncbi:MAG: dihydrodipicolinate synthase family protein [candidate division KSB1 bacterium]|nr:dihydrodipicolinate synthase family protein [candidate division KSB1 bacterium]